jgi:2-keto-4-pentenoate hydratase
MVDPSEPPATQPGHDAHHLEQTLWAATRTFPVRIDTPLDVAAGQRLQVRLLGRWRALGHEVGGWKVGMTSGDARDALGVGVRPFGYVLADRIVPSGAQIAIGDIAIGGVENELCFRFARTPPRHCPPESIADYLDGVAPGFEINQRRLDMGAPAPAPGIRVADDLSNWGMVHGAFVPLPGTLDDLVVTLTRDGEPLARVEARGHIDDHLVTLARLAAALPDHGLAIEPGHVVITGAYGRAPLLPGLHAGDFGALGRVELTLA